MSVADTLHALALARGRAWFTREDCQAFKLDTLNTLSTADKQRYFEKMALFDPLFTDEILKKLPTLNPNFLQALSEELTLPALPHKIALTDPLMLIRMAMKEENDIDLAHHWQKFYSSYNLLSPDLLEGAKISLFKTHINKPLAKPHQPTVSVIVTAFNEEKTIEMAVMSLVHQTHLPLEIIIVDDASLDKTLSICQKLANQFPIIKVIALSENKGSYAAKNAGLKVAKGDIITCHDADDFAHPQRLAIQLLPLIENKEVIASISRFFRIDEHTTMPVAKRLYPILRLNPSSLLFRREVLDKYGYYDEVRFGADNEFIDRIKVYYGEASIKTVNKPLALGLQRQKSLTNSIETGISPNGRSNLREAYIATYKNKHHQIKVELLKAKTLPRSFFQKFKLKIIQQSRIENYFIGFKPWKNLIGDWFPLITFEVINRNLSEIEFLKLYGKQILLANNPCFYVWGDKYPDYIRAFAVSYSIRMIYLEDGFIRQKGIKDKSPPLSLVVDSRGNYFDCQKESDLEHLFNYAVMSIEMLKEAKSLYDRFIQLNLSKYNLTAGEMAFDNNKEKILILGQVEGDASLKYGSNITDIKQLIEIAIAENPDADVFYKPHPRNFGENLAILEQQFPSLQFIEASFSFISILKPFDKIYTITSLAGFEAILHGKNVVTLGAPFYSGWGLTDDRMLIPRRKTRRSILEAFAITYILYPIYLDNKGRRQSLKDVMDKFKNL